ncbi:MAG TPA: ATP-grasp domain-containing protein [Spirochaetota bacterium]|nr:MAG: D-alanine--D-alanine ligase [Spirochaetes bacterium ADurb.BinA120]HPI14732.1 ATP-grasp domain-containing protein [Spirochaetota bacterium]HPO44775.1 ATP-grasp domain-containing protein [Spirochaetota bacterium]
MPSLRDAAELPVLVMYNLDTEWKQADKMNQKAEIELMSSSLEGLGHPVSRLEINGNSLHRTLSGYEPSDWIVMNLCEEIPGVPHSEATVAHLLESRNMIYTGSPPEIIGNCENKQFVKHTLSALGLPTPLWGVYENPFAPDWSCFPAIVKPANEHCSLGISSESVVLDRGELERQIRFIHHNFNQPALVEDFIDGREFHVSMIGNGSLLMLPPVEMDFSACNDIHDRLCTFDAKFIPGSKHYEIITSLIPASLSEGEYGELERTCFDCFRAFECRDYARLDIRLRDGIFYILDINPNPDISSDASMACAAEYMGITYGELGSRLVRLAASRHPLLG